MITAPKLDKASLLAEQKLRDYIEEFERKFLDYRYPEVEDGTITNQTTGFGGEAEASASADKGLSEDILGGQIT